jgi:hypothetical protein
LALLFKENVACRRSLALLQATFNDGACSSGVRLTLPAEPGRLWHITFYLPLSFSMQILSVRALAFTAAVLGGTAASHAQEPAAPKPSPAASATGKIGAAAVTVN